jgi:CRISPR system Cascade subunit CasB
MNDAIPNGNKQSPEVRLVERLIKLAEEDNRGALAALRTGLGKPPGAAPRMLPIIARYLVNDDGPSTRAAFLTAALFASHPDKGGTGSLGQALRRATKGDSRPNGKHGEAGVEARLAAALDADSEDLPRHLEGLVGLCESASIPINWREFYWDVWSLLGDDEGRQIRTRTHWARDYWRPESSADESADTKENNKE